MRSFVSSILLGLLLAVFTLCLTSSTVLRVAYPSSGFSDNIPELSIEGRVNLGMAINTRYEETKPILTPDGLKLFFARKHSPQNVGGAHDPQDIYFSTTTDGIHWARAEHGGRYMNTKSADNLCGVIDDNNFIFFVREGKKGRFVVRRTTSTGFLEVRIGPQVLSESDFLEACFSFHQNVVLFTAKTGENLSYRRDVDERDIYISTIAHGRWSEPVNLGTAVNSPGDEYSPFLASDGRTLYFATDGRGGAGGVDVFVTRRIGDDWSHWSTPVNLGSQVNSEGFDAYFTVSPAADRAFMVAHNNTLGKGDIISLVLPAAFRPSSPAIPIGPTPAMAPNFRSHILFEQSTASVLPSYFYRLDSIANLLVLHPSLRVQLDGHTDNKGTSASLKSLSNNRVEVVRAYLKSKGVAPTRMSGKGFGGTVPAVGNTTEENRRKNRRVELTVY